MSWVEGAEVQTVHLGGAVDNSKHSSGKARESVTQGAPQGTDASRGSCFFQVPGEEAAIEVNSPSWWLQSPCQLLIKAESAPVASAGSWSHHPAEV